MHAPNLEIVFEGWIGELYSMAPGDFYTCSALLSFSWRVVPASRSSNRRLLREMKPSISIGVMGDCTAKQAAMSAVVYRPSAITPSQRGCVPSAGTLAKEVTWA